MMKEQILVYLFFILLASLGKAAVFYLEDIVKPNRELARNPTKSVQDFIIVPTRLNKFAESIIMITEICTAS